VTATADLLERLDQLGVVADVQGTGLRLRPASKVPADLLADLRAHKTEVLARLAAANDAPPVTPPAANTMQGLPDAEWVDAMAEALAANSIHTITNRDTAMPYFRGRALAMLAATPDPYARGLLLGFERHRHVLAAPPQVHRDDHRRDQPTPNRQNPLTAERTPQ
jgi:hypothetical protein